MIERKNSLYGVLLYIVLFLLGLEIALRFFNVPSYVLPLPSVVFKYMGAHAPLFMKHSLVTFCESLLGVFLAWILGLVLGGVCVYFRRIDELLSPLIFVLQVIPVIALGPFIILWFGFGLLSKVWVVFIFALYPIIMAFKEGVLSIDPELFYVVKLLKASHFHIFRYILLPACFLRTILGVKLALTYSVTSAVVAELLGASEGLGVLLVRSLADFNALALFGVIYMIIAMSFLFFGGISFLEIKARRRLGL